MKKLILISVLFAFVLSPVFVLAMDHSKMKDMDHSKMEDMDHDKKKEMEHNTMDHSKMEGMDHSGMAMDGDMVMLGTLVVDGVKASAHVKNVGKAMAKMGMKQTHHLMVNFVSVEKGAPIAKGKVAVKIKNPDESEAKPVKLMGMDGHFGADLVLQEKGVYHLYVGTKLEDGVKRQFHFHTEVK